MSKPPPLTPSTRHSRRSPGIAHIVLVNFLISVLYTALTVASIERPDGVIGTAMRTWRDLTRGLFDALLFFLPSPTSATDPGLALRVSGYRHVMVVCMFLTLWSVFASRPYWPHWAEQLKKRVRSVPTALPPTRAFFVHAYRRVIVGSAAAAMLLLFGEPRNDTAVAFLYGNSWTFFRAPLLSTIACALACHAAALRSCVPDD